MISGQLIFGLVGAGVGAISGLPIGALIGLFIPTSNSARRETASRMAVLSVEPRPGQETEIKAQLRRLGGQTLYQST